MTREQALNIMKKKYADITLSEAAHESYYLAISALKKQIPLDVLVKDGDALCPVCNSRADYTGNIYVVNDGIMSYASHQYQCRLCSGDETVLIK